MNIVFDPKEYPEGRHTLSDPLEVDDEFLQDEVWVIDGQWTCLFSMSWHSRTLAEHLKNNPYPRSNYEEFPGWFFYSNLSIMQAAGSVFSAERGFSTRESLDFVKGYAAAVVRNASVRKVFDSPSELHFKKREEIAELISQLHLEYPPLPSWVAEPPVAVFGEGLTFYREIIGKVFCEVNDDFAVEIYFEAWINRREATNEEMQLIKEKLS